MPGVELIPPTVEAIQSAARIAKWPEDAGTIDLGGRLIDVLAIPGHDQASIALYDRRTGLLLTGDSLYPWGPLCTLLCRRSRCTRRVPGVTG